MVIFCILAVVQYLCTVIAGALVADRFSLAQQIFMIKLSSLTIGRSAVIREFEKSDIHIKLMEMGCVPGETIKVEKIAPLGDPICIIVAGYNLSLRKTEADHIWVEEIAV